MAQLIYIDDAKDLGLAEGSKTLSEIEVLLVLNGMKDLSLEALCGVGELLGFKIQTRGREFLYPSLCRGDHT